MVRQIIHIDEEKCNGCGICAKACHESAIAIIDGKAKLIRDDYCDGMGDCLPGCPTGAITFENREAPQYDREAVEANMKRKREINRRTQESVEETGSNAAVPASQLTNWPVQIKLAPIQAPYFQGAKLLIAADCTAYAYANFHKDFIRGKVTLIGCPKLDAIDYSEKLTEIIKSNDITSVTIVRMEVPCCGGLAMAAQKALQNSGKLIPWQIVTISIDGQILDR
ncbi:MAG: 4Fe-4S binding protein [Eubacteriales bacterium]|nr:4Fe-4S binding protein [Eubacteriales bacterium]